MNFKFIKNMYIAINKFAKGGATKRREALTVRYIMDKLLELATFLKVTQCNSNTVDVEKNLSTKLFIQT